VRYERVLLRILIPLLNLVISFSNYHPPLGACEYGICTARSQLQWRFGKDVGGFEPAPSAELLVRFPNTVEGIVAVACVIVQRQREGRRGRRMSVEGVWVEERQSRRSRVPARRDALP